MPLQADFLKECDLPYPLASQEEIEDYRTQLSQVAYHTYLAKGPEGSQSEPLTVQELSDMGYRKVPFENVRFSTEVGLVLLSTCVAHYSSSAGPRSGGYKEGLPQQWVRLRAQ